MVGPVFAVEEGYFSLYRLSTRHYIDATESSCEEAKSFARSRNIGTRYWSQVTNLVSRGAIIPAHQPIFVIVVV
jgi:hypothetical protein